MSVVSIDVGVVCDFFSPTTAPPYMTTWVQCRVSVVVKMRHEIGIREEVPKEKREWEVVNVFPHSPVWSWKTLRFEALWTVCAMGMFVVCKRGRLAVVIEDTIVHTARYLLHGISQVTLDDL